MVRGGLADGWLSSSRSIRSSQLGRPADTMVGETASPGAEGVGVGVAAGRSEVIGVGVGAGKVVVNGGTDEDTGATMVEAALDPQAMLSVAITKKINIRMAGLIAGFMECIIASSPLGGPKR